MVILQSLLYGCKWCCEVLWKRGGWRSRASIRYERTEEGPEMALNFCPVVAIECLRAPSRLQASHPASNASYTHVSVADEEVLFVSRDWVHPTQDTVDEEVERMDEVYSWWNSLRWTLVRHLITVVEMRATPKINKESVLDLAC